MKNLLFTPGPVPLPPQVLAAMQAPMISHKSDEFTQLFTSLSERLKRIFHTEGPVITLSCSGTGSAEAAICNTLSPGGKVLVLVNGRFSKRWSEMLSAFGLDVYELCFEWGSLIDTGKLGEFLGKNGDFSAVWMTHSETSTGILNDVEEISAMVRAHSDALVCVDTVSSLGGHPFRFDDWKIDVAVSAPQKALMAPPGLGLLALSERAWLASERSALPRFYFDLKRARKELGNGTTPWTPAIQEIRALDCALGLILAEGLERFWERHRSVSLQVKDRITSLGLEIFGQEDYRKREEYFSRTVTAVATERAAEILKLMKSEYGVEFAGGQDHLKDRVFRFGHAGFVEQDDLDYTFSALEKLLQE